MSQLIANLSVNGKLCLQLTARQIRFGNDIRKLALMHLSNLEICLSATICSNVLQISQIRIGNHFEAHGIVPTGGELHRKTNYISRLVMLFFRFGAKGELLYLQVATGYGQSCGVSCQVVSWLSVVPRVRVVLPNNFGHKVSGLHILNGHYVVGIFAFMFLAHRHL